MTTKLASNTDADYANGGDRVNCPYSIYEQDLIDVEDDASIQTDYNTDYDETNCNSNINQDKTNSWFEKHNVIDCNNGDKSD